VTAGAKADRDERGIAEFKLRTAWARNSKRTSSQAALHGCLPAD